MVSDNHLVDISRLTSKPYDMITWAAFRSKLKSSGIWYIIFSRKVVAWTKYRQSIAVSFTGLYGKMSWRPCDSQYIPFFCFRKSSLRQGMQHHASDVLPLKAIQTFRRQVQAYLEVTIMIDACPFVNTCSLDHVNFRMEVTMKSNIKFSAREVRQHKKVGLKRCVHCILAVSKGRLHLAHWW